MDRGQLTSNAIDGCDDIRAGLAEDDDRNRALAVQIAGGANILYRVGNLGHVGEMNGGSVVIADNERLVILRCRNLIIIQNVRRSRAVGDLALRQIRILQAQHGLQIGHGEAIAGQFRGVRIDAHGRECAASHADLAHSRNLRQLLFHDGGSFVIQFGRAELV